MYMCQVFLLMLLHNFKKSSRENVNIRFLFFRVLRINNKKVSLLHIFKIINLWKKKKKETYMQ